MELPKSAGTPVTQSFPVSLMLKVTRESQLSTTTKCGMKASELKSIVLLKTMKKNVSTISLANTTDQMCQVAGPGGNATGRHAMTQRMTVAAMSAGSKTATRTVAKKMTFAESGTHATMITNGISGLGTLRNAIRALMDQLTVVKLTLRTTSKAPSTRLARCLMMRMP